MNTQKQPQLPKNIPSLQEFAGDWRHTLRIGALYIRVSTHDQDELSPDAQIRLGLDFAKSNNIVIPKEFIFVESVSGRKASKRREFQRMISIAKSSDHPIDVIIVWKFSRFARNQEESIVYKSMLKKDGVDVLSVSEPLVEGPFGSLIERIIEWMDEYYSIRLSGEVTRGMIEKALRGGYQARPPLGYKIAERGKPPVIVPEEAVIVRTIFDKYVNEKMSFFDIARYLNSLGLKTSHNKPYEARSIDYIIKNPTYCGMIRWNMTSNETKEIKDKSEWIIVDGHHEPIISKELFEAAQERFNSTYKPKGARPSSTYKHWLSGLLKCPDCGRTMIAKSVAKKSDGSPYVYFSCYGYCKGKCLKSNSISSLKLEPLILSAFDTILASGEINFSYKEIIPIEEINERELLEEQLKMISLKEDRIKQAYRDGIDTLEEYKRNKEIIENERQEIAQRLEECSLTKPEPIDEKEIMLQDVENVHKYISSEEYTNQQKNDMLRSIVDKIIYNRENNTLDLFFYRQKTQQNQGF